MQTYLIPPHGETVLLHAAPSTREEAIALILQHGPWPDAVRPFRIVSVEEFDLTHEESCEVVVFAIGLRNYRGGRWGLVEASASAYELSAEFSPTSEDMTYWLEALRECWQVEPSDFRFTLEQVDDCHLLQFIKGSRVLTSVTWNASDEHTHFLMPKTLDTPRHLWGNALLPDVGLLYDAFGGLNF